MSKKVILIIIFSLLYLIPLLLVISNHHQKINNKVNYLIVLGAKVNADKPSKALEERLQQARDYYDKHPRVKIVVSGGRGLDEQYSEAEVMKNYLINQGIAAKQIIVEDKSTSTQENLENTKKIIGPQKSIGLITNDFHIYRASLLCNKIFKTKCQLQTANTHLRDSFIYYLREPFALYKSLWFLVF